MQDRHGVYLDEDVAPLVLDVIGTSKRYVFLVSPWIKLWRQADMALDAALRRGVEVTVVVRSGENPVDNDQVKWLLNQGATVFATDGLHSKVYFNESLTVISSMNILGGSPKSLEVALAIGNTDDAKKLRHYVHDRVIPTSTRIRSPRDLIDGPPMQIAPRAVAPMSGRSRCIHCGTPVALAPATPMCAKCQTAWAEWGNEDYPESYCHSCGMPAWVTYRRPLCIRCFSG